MSNFFLYLGNLTELYPILTFTIFLIFVAYSAYSVAFILNTDSRSLVSTGVLALGILTAHQIVEGSIPDKTCFVQSFKEDSFEELMSSIRKKELNEKMAAINDSISVANQFGAKNILELEKEKQMLESSLAEYSKPVSPSIEYYIIKEGSSGYIAFSSKKEIVPDWELSKLRDNGIVLKTECSQDIVVSVTEYQKNLVSKN